MPYKNKMPCMYPGCPALVSKGRYCQAHKRESKGYYSSKEWRQLRAQVLEEEPICTICGKAPSTEAEHKIPRSRGGPDERWNLRGTCKSCHSKKTRVEVSR